MKFLTGIICSSLILATTGSAPAGEMIVREYPDRFVVEYDGTNDPKPAPYATQVNEAAVEQSLQMNENRNNRVKNRMEERMEKTRMRTEENQKALERRKKEQEGRPVSAGT